MAALLLIASRAILKIYISVYRVVGYFVPIQAKLSVAAGFENLLVGKEDQDKRGEASQIIRGSRSQP